MYSHTYIFTFLYIGSRGCNSLKVFEKLLMSNPEAAKYRNPYGKNIFHTVCTDLKGALGVAVLSLLLSVCSDGIKELDEGNFLLVSDGNYDRINHNNYNNITDNNYNNNNNKYNNDVKCFPCSYYCNNVHDIFKQHSICTFKSFMCTYIYCSM